MSDEEIDSDKGPLTFTPEEVYNKVMTKIHECLDADLDQDLTEDEDLFENGSVIRGKLCKDIKEAEDTEKTIEIIEEKWEVLTEGNWKEFADEKAVFHYIAEKVRESIDSNDGDKVNAKTELEILLQI